jgi:serine/threonine-protein kinase
MTRTSINPGDQLDHYRIDSVVSRSDAATVFRARDLRTNRHVALKVPPAEMETDPAFFDRFQREQEIGEHLDHPGLLKVLGDHDRSQIYMVTEWFEGKPLRQILSETRKLPQERAVRIAVRICDALGYIHNHGIVHRDLKPENIMLDTEDHIKLLDFGIAAKTGARRITFTKLSQFVGSSEYVSPEELKGTHVDARSDIYALGVILYEMLTGQTPFQGAEPAERLLRHPIPPREIDPGISPQLQEVIYRALEREPRNRCTNAQEFARDLKHLDQVGVADRSELRDWKRQRKSRTNNIVLYIAIAVIPLVIFGLLLYFARR